MRRNAGCALVVRANGMQVSVGAAAVAGTAGRCIGVYVHRASSSRNWLAVKRWQLLGVPARSSHSSVIRLSVPVRR